MMSQQIAGYYESWSMPWVGNGTDAELANLTHYNTVILSFMQPDTTYPGGETFQGTGIQFSSDAPVVKQAIQALRAKGVKVLLAVGGATYPNWSSLNAAGIALFIREFGLDGCDIDFEPSDPACTLDPSDNKITCTTDALYISIVQDLRNALPRPLLLTAATWSVGAYGEDEYRDASPVGSPYTGVALRMLSEVGHLLDQVHVMAYDAGDSFNSTIAYDAYRRVYPGSILMGIEVPPDAAGGHSTTPEEVRSLCEHVKRNNGQGVFVWSIQKVATGGMSAEDIVCIAKEVFI